MALISVSVRTLPAYRRLAKLSDQQFRSVLDSLATASPSPDLGGLVEQAAASGVPEAASFVEAVAASGSFASTRHLTPAEIAGEMDFSGLRISATALANLRARVQTLLETSAVWLSGRALDLILAERSFVTSARFLTDLRPVFEPGKNGDDLPSPTAALVLHSLVLEYNDGGEDRVMSVAFDASDLVSLRSAIERAEKKARALQRFMEGASIVDVSPKATE